MCESSGIAYPAWIQESDLGPPEDLDVWDQYDGKGRVDVLYRGVFVERLEVDQLWGFEGQSTLTRNISDQS